MVRQSTLLVLVNSGPHFLLTPFSSAPNTLCLPWLLQGGAGGKGWDVWCFLMPWGPGSLWACRSCMCSIQVPGDRFLELHTWKKEGNFASTEWSHFRVRNSGSRTLLPSSYPRLLCSPKTMLTEVQMDIFKFWWGSLVQARWLGCTRWALKVVQPWGDRLIPWASWLLQACGFPPCVKWM